MLIGSTAPEDYLYDARNTAASARRAVPPATYKKHTFNLE
jgi:hypothetical protein